jgi:hypothetical protein
MYGEAALYEDQENAEHVRFFIETIAQALGVPATESDIRAAVYKQSSSGIWTLFDEEGIVVGTLIGCNGEYSERISSKNVACDAEGAALLTQRFWGAVTNCDIYAVETWKF